MGRRGPIAGAANAGRPPGDSKSPSAARTAKSGGPSSASLVSEWASSLISLTFDELREHCGRWRDLEPQDHLLVAVLFDLVREYARLQQYLNRKAVHKRVQMAESGYQSAIPEVAMRDKARAELLKLGLKFGLSPGDRARMGDPPAEDDDEDPLADAWQEGREIHQEQVSTNKAAKNGPAKKRTRSTPLRSGEVPRPSPKRKKASWKVRATRDRKTAP